MLINLQSLGLFQNTKETLKSVLPPKDNSHFPARSGYPGPYFCPVKAQIIFFSTPLRLPHRHLYFSFPFSLFPDRLVILAPLLRMSDIISRHAQYLQYYSILYAKQSNTKYPYQQLSVYNATFHTKSFGKC